MKRILFSVLLVISLFSFAFVVSHITARHAEALSTNICSAAGNFSLTPPMLLLTPQNESATLETGTINTCTDPAYPWANATASASGFSSCAQIYLSGTGSFIWQGNKNSISDFTFTISTSVSHINQIGINARITSGPFSPGTFTAAGVISPIDLANCALGGTSILTFTFAEVVFIGP